MMTFEELRAQWGYVETFSLEDAIVKWQRFVLAVEAGYEATLYEYEAELGFREELDSVVNERDAEILRSWDERFVSASVTTADPMLQAPDDGRLPIWGRAPSSLRSVDDDVAATWRS